MKYFNPDGNTAIRYDIYKPDASKDDWSWDVWLMPNKALADSLNENKRKQMETIKISGEGFALPHTIVDGICNLIEKSNLPENKDLGISIGPIQTKLEIAEDITDLVLSKIKEKFGVELLDSNISAPEKK